jgi:hypothetical protein
MWYVLYGDGTERPQVDGPFPNDDPNDAWHVAHNQRVDEGHDLVALIYGPESILQAVLRGFPTTPHGSTYVD